MSSYIRRVSSIWRPSNQQENPPSASITASSDLPWEPLGAADDNLLRELEQLYWEGISRELEVIIVTLKKWQESEDGTEKLSDESDHFIHGYDTFIDQVSKGSRDFAAHYSTYISFEPLAAEML